MAATSARVALVSSPNVQLFMGFTVPLGRMANKRPPIHGRARAVPLDLSWRPGPHRRAPRWCPALFVLPLAMLALASCAFHAPLPSELPRDASGGHAPPAFNRAIACAQWSDAAGLASDAAQEHDSFPELDPSR